MPRRSACKDQKGTAGRFNIPTCAYFFFLPASAASANFLMKGPWILQRACRCFQGSVYQTLGFRWEFSILMLLQVLVHSQRHLLDFFLAVEAGDGREFFGGLKQRLCFSKGNRPVCFSSSPFQPTSLLQQLISLWYNCNICSAWILQPAARKQARRWANQTSGGLPGYLFLIVSPQLPMGRHIEYKGLFPAPSVCFDKTAAHFGS